MNHVRIVSVSLVLIGMAAPMGAQRSSSAAATPPATTAMKAIGTVKDVMTSITIPSSDEVFKAAGEPPTNEAGWSMTRLQALALAESANLLLMTGRARDAGAWTQFSIAQRDAAVSAMRAAEAKNADALSSASDALYETCANCHKKYMSGK